MAPRSPSPPPRRRSPAPSNSRSNYDRRSRSPASCFRRDEDRYDNNRRSKDYSEDRYDRRDRRGDRGGGEGKYDRRRDDDRRRSRSPDRRAGGASKSERPDGRGKEREIEGGDGGWGKRGASPGRPSQALPSQQALTRKDGEEPPPKSIEPNFQQSGALAAETK